MKLIHSFAVLLAAAAVWCPAGFAQRQLAVGPGITPLDATGVLNGVDMQASGLTGTLSVGVPGGPQTDIFTANNPPAAGLLAVSTQASSQGNIVFNSSSRVFGDIGITQPGGPFLLNLAAGASGTAVNFQGSVFATQLNLTGTGVVNFNSGATNILATNFGADGTITLAPNTIVIGALTTTAGASTGTLSLGGGSVLDGAVGGAVGLRSINVTGGSNLAGVNATITGATNAFAFDLGTNTLNIGGALTIANLGPSGVINTTLASPTVFGNIRPTGATNLGPTLLVNVTVPSTAFIPVGTQFNIVQTATGTQQSGTDGTVLTVQVQSPTNPLYSFSAVPPAGTIAGLVAIRTDSIPLLVPVQPGDPVAPTQPVAAAVVSVLLTLNPSADLTQVLAAINALSDPRAVVDAVTQLAPSSPAQAAGLVKFFGARQFQDLKLAHQDDLLAGTRNTSPSWRPDDRRDGWWAKTYGDFADQGAVRAFEGYDSRILGAIAGYDRHIGRGTRGGLGVGYARSKIDAKLFDSDTEFDTVQGTAYLGHVHGPWAFYADLSLGSDDYSGRRHVLFPGVDRVARAQYDGSDVTGFGSASYHINAGKYTITPQATLQRTRVKVDRYTETGAGDINLTVNAQKYDFLESGLGVRVARTFGFRNRTCLPSVHAKWLHLLDNPTFSNTSVFPIPGSVPFTTPGLGISDDTGVVGANLLVLADADSDRPLSIEANYDYRWRSDRFDAHQGTLKLTRRF